MTAENTKLTCPDCGGSIERIQEGSMVQYRCRVGHLYSPQNALAGHYAREENTLWSAVVLLEEGADLAEDIAALETTEEPNQLRKEAEARRKLAQRIRDAVLELPKVVTR